MIRFALLFLVSALFLGALGFFESVTSGFIWALFGGFLVLTIVILASVFVGFGGKSPMD
jgi:hypothetical protein